MEKRVVVTGIGAVTPLGVDFQRSWEAVKQGRTGIDLCTKGLLLAGRQKRVAAGEIEKSFDPHRYLSPKEAGRTDPFVWYAVSAASMAAEDAFTEGGWRGGSGCSVIIGSSRGGVTRLEEAASTERYSAFLMPGSHAGAAASHIARKLGVTGRTLGLSSACASGMQAVGEGYTYIKNGLETMCLCGGAEAPLARFCVEAYYRCGALSRTPAPWASRPFDSGRDGFVLAEGACVLVLEELEHALQRGTETKTNTKTRIYGEICGYGCGMDACHDTRPDPSGQARAMEKALEGAGLAAENIGLLLAHATGTRLGDKAEEEAIKLAFGERASTVPVFAAKALTGHMLAASGPFEAALALMCVREGLLPGNKNLKKQEGGLNLPARTQNAPVRAAMANSFGLGGFNASVVIKRYE